MSEFWDALEEYIGDADDIFDIRAVVRRCWFYDFNGYPIRVWQGKGKLFTSDGNEWLGTIDALDNDIHTTPPIQDGRDGSSATYNFTLAINDIPGQSAGELYEAIKAEQSRVSGRNLTCYLALFKEGEGLRPTTPITFFKELTMVSPRFSEKLGLDTAGAMVRSYFVTVTCKDSNFGRSNIPGGTYADTIQKERARQLGVALDRGAEFLALLANRTYQLK
ncbi:hypothetical protein [Rhizobium phage RHph_X2_24]|nr:hypothetical protein [Rhizobium phage RHph_X2_24]